MVKGTEVNFHCHYQETWQINNLPPVPGTVNFITSNETGQYDDMQIIADQKFIDRYGNVPVIRCINVVDQSMFAALTITGD